MKFKSLFLALVVASLLFVMPVSLADDGTGDTVMNESEEPVYCKGDMNDDQEVNFGDITPFEKYLKVHNWEKHWNADVNDDGFVDTRDADEFVELVRNPNAAVECTTEMPLVEAYLSNGVKGDMNGDGSLDIGDINPFVEFIDIHNSEFFWNADVTSDGFVDTRDTEAFIALLNGDKICTDSDGGLDWKKAGKVTWGENTYKDTCDDESILTEYFCDDANMPHASPVDCTKYGLVCKRGACTKEVALIWVDFLITLDHMAPVSDVKIAVSIDGEMREKGYDFDEGWLPFNVLDATSFCNKEVVLAIYKGQAVVVTGSDYPDVFLEILLDRLDELNVPFVVVDCTDISTPDVKDLFGYGPVYTCDDYDNGLDYYTASQAVECVEYINGNNGGAGCKVIPDICLAASGEGDDDEVTLFEAYCTDENRAKTIGYTCPYGCNDGACVKEPGEVSWCTDYDGGEDFFTASYAEECHEGNNTGYCVGFEDTCMGDDELREAVCVDNELSHVDTICYNGCFDGACIQELEFCYDSDGHDIFERGYVDTGEYPEPVYDSCCINCNSENEMPIGGLYVREQYCNSGDAMTDTIFCKWGCEYGECLTKGKPVLVYDDLTYCGQNENVVHFHGEGGVAGFWRVNQCVKPNVAAHYYCSGEEGDEQLLMTIEHCDGDCENGMCMPEPPQKIVIQEMELSEGWNLIPIGDGIDPEFEDDLDDYLEAAYIWVPSLGEYKDVLENDDWIDEVIDDYAYSALWLYLNDDLELTVYTYLEEVQETLESFNFEDFEQGWNYFVILPQLSKYYEGGWLNIGEYNPGGDTALRNDRVYAWDNDDKEWEAGYYTRDILEKEDLIEDGLVGIPISMYYEDWFGPQFSPTDDPDVPDWPGE